MPALQHAPRPERLDGRTRNQDRAHTVQSARRPSPPSIILVFARYYIGQAISLVGTWLQGAAVRWLVFEQTHSEFMLGVVEVASLMPGLLVGLFAGALADRVAPLRMIVIMECGQMALAFVLALLVWLQVFQVWQMALILALARICVTFELPSRQVFFFELVGPENLSNAIALNSGLFNATRVVGPALAGVGLSMLGAAGLLRLEWPELPGRDRGGALDPAGAIDRAPRSQALSPQGAFRRSGLPEDRPADLRPVLLVAFFGFVGMGYEAMVPAYAQTGRRDGGRWLQHPAGVQRDRRDGRGLRGGLAGRPALARSG